MEILVTEMNPSDEIKIRTQFSDYRFRVTDPVECRGVLTGGKLGTDLHEALLAEAIHPEACETRASVQLEPGDRAVFLFAGNELKRLTTSTITEIVLSELTDTSTGDC